MATTAKPTQPTTERQPGAYPYRNKKMYIARVKAHRKADELVRGVTWESNGTQQGCAVGCTLHTYDHGRYPELLGVPEQIAHLEDWLFENMPTNHLMWPERFLSAIQEGADLSKVYPQWVVRTLKRRLVSLGNNDEPWHKQCKEAIEGVCRLFENGMPTEAAARAARAAAGAAEAAARSAWTAWTAEIKHQTADLIELLKAAPVIGAIN